jgi:cellulose synthase/poly-beta-1,6-N-acetylglucosamine synthase-like glycosyltransferase
MSSASSALGPAVLALYYLILAILAFFGVHRLWMVLLYLKTRRRIPPCPPDPELWPLVTVQLPLYNEMYVATRLVDAVCRLDYPRDRLEIQILDDSTDETTAIVGRLVEEHRRQGIDIKLVHRDDRRGFKAGALAAGLERARGELLAVFDADFVPQVEFLRLAVPYFADPAIGLVQGRWMHINRCYSLLTRVQSIFLDGHFMIEHIARNRSNCFFNFNGTAGVWRREAIVAGGGWEHDTLTEDLDLSYRAQLIGWKFLYLPELAVPSELPVDVNGFKTQQYRWAKGAIQTGRKLIGRVLVTPLPPRVKFEALVHLTNNISYPLMLLLSLLIFPAMLLRRGTPMRMLTLVDLPFFFAATASVLVFYLMSQVASGSGWRKQLRYLPALMGMGIGLSVVNSHAVLSGLVQRGGTFHRTPKYRIENSGQEWRGKRYRAGVSSSFAVEAALAVYFVFCTTFAVVNGMWLSIPFLLLFVQGYGYMALLSIVPALDGLRLARAGESWQG